MIIANAHYTLTEMITNAIVFGTIGAIMMLLFGWFLFDKVTKGINFTSELVKEKNTAVAIVIAGFLIGIAHVIAAAIGG